MSSISWKRTSKDENGNEALVLTQDKKAMIRQIKQKQRYENKNKTLNFWNKLKFLE